jgi:hypothetical protein
MPSGLRTNLKNNLSAVLAPFGLQRFQNSSKYFRYSSSFFNRFGANGIQNALKAIFEIGSSWTTLAQSRVKAKKEKMKKVIE